MHTCGAGRKRGDTEKNHTKKTPKPSTKTQTNGKDKEIQIDWRVWSHWHYASFFQVVGFVTLQELFLFPFHLLVEEFCLTLLFLQGINSHQSCLRSQDVHAAFSEVMASRVRVMGSIEILGGFWGGYWKYTHSLHENCQSYRDNYCYQCS